MPSEKDITIKRECSLKDEIVEIKTYYYTKNGELFATGIHALSIENAKAVAEFVAKQEKLTILEEGHRCPECNVGLMEYVVENCSCHISPPCSACVEAPLECRNCGYESMYYPNEDV